MSDAVGAYFHRHVVSSDDIPHYDASSPLSTTTSHNFHTYTELFTDHVKLSVLSTQYRQPDKF